VKVRRFVASALLAAVLASVIWTVAFLRIVKSAQKGFQPINDPPPPAVVAFIEQTPTYRRREDASYLAFPEWYLVFCPQEYAAFIRTNPPSRFPYFTSIGQLWWSYAQVCGLTKGHYAFNSGDHLTMVTIVSSSSIEFGIKGGYEKTIGRLFETIGGRSAEDDYAAQVAKDYGDFIPTQPWYDFPFGQRLEGLWSTNRFFGPNFLRKCERRFFLSAEYGVKAVYAGLIRFASHSVYGVADTEVYASAHLPSDSIQIKRVKQLENDLWIVAVPHYQGFTDALPQLARDGVQFEEVAGNDEMLATVIAPNEWSYDLTAGRPLFTMGLLSDEARKRVAVQVPVKSLTQILREIEAKGLKLEHLFDY